jgi:replicative DNA helicase
MNPQEIRLPHAAEAERAIAGCLINFPIEGSQKLQSNYFGAHSIVDPLARDIVTLVMGRVSRGESADFVSVVTELKVNWPSLEPARVTDFAGDGISLAALPSWIDAVKAADQRRKAIQLSILALERLQGRDSTTDILESARTEIQTLQRTGETKLSKTWGEQIADRLNLYTYGKDQKNVIKTGFAELDDVMPLERSDFLVIGGTTGSGKTMLALNIVANVLRVEGEGACVICSLEMPAGQITDRLLSADCKVGTKRLKQGALFKHEMERVEAGIQRIYRWPLVLRDDCHTLADIMAVARGVHSAKGLRVLMVDYLQLVTGPTHELREQQVAEVSRTLRLLAIETGALVIAITQLNKNGDARESSQVNMDATQVVTVSMVDVDGVRVAKPTEDVELDQRHRRIDIGKQRDGVVGASLLLGFEGECARFYEEAGK